MQTENTHKQNRIGRLSDIKSIRKFVATQIRRSARGEISSIDMLRQVSACRVLYEMIAEAELFERVDRLEKHANANGSGHYASA